MTTPTQSFFLFLDDIRDPSWIHHPDFPKKPDSDWVIARSFQEFVSVIEERGLPDFISFDHDLADYEADGSENPNAHLEKTGHDCAKWLIDYCLDWGVLPPRYFVHSQNPVGAENIRGLIDGYRSYAHRQGWLDHKNDQAVPPIKAKL